MPSRKHRQKGKPKAATAKTSWSWLWVVIVLVVVAVIRIHLLDMPLERDEGEYAYAGQLILHGVPPYQLAYNMKLPGTYCAYALLMALFGQTAAGFRFGFLLVNAATAVLIYFLAKRLSGPVGGATAAASFAWLSLDPAVLGPIAHATHFVILPVVGGTLLLLKALETKKTLSLLWSGLLFGLALLMKQPGAFFALFGAGYIAWTGWRDTPRNWGKLIRHLAIFSTGVVLPYGMTCLVLCWAGVFGHFWFWTVTYLKEYGTQITLPDGLIMFRMAVTPIVSSAWWLWIFVAGGLVALFLDPAIKAWRELVLGLVVMSALAVVPGLHFSPHYFVLFIPAAAVLIGLAVSSLRLVLMEKRPLKLPKGLAALLFAIALAAVAFPNAKFLVESTPLQVCRALYGPHPFPESVSIGRYLKEHAARGDRLAVFGSEPQVYFYSGLRSATGYIYMYALTEPHPYARKMTQEMIAEVEGARPEFIVFVNLPQSWSVFDAFDKGIFDWVGRYCKTNYKQVGLIELNFPQPNREYWDADAAQRRPVTPFFISVCRRTQAK